VATLGFFFGGMFADEQQSSSSLRGVLIKAVLDPTHQNTELRCAYVDVLVGKNTELIY
jgi:hypothetical protein